MTRKNGSANKHTPSEREQLIANLGKGPAMTADEVRLNDLGLENEQLLVQVERLRQGASPAQASQPATDEELAALLDQLLDDDSDDEDLFDTPAAIERFERQNDALRNEVRELVAAYHASATRV
jgi:hypothetical protein